jgi:hypothetical protein
MIVHGEQLYISTSNKGGQLFDERFDFMSEEQSREYGAVYRMALPGATSGHIRWKQTPTLFRFELGNEAIRVFQDGVLLGENTTPNTPIPGLEDLTFQWGAGVYGVCPARLLDARVSRGKPPSSRSTARWPR